MKKITFFLFAFVLIGTISCQNKVRKETHQTVEVKVEKTDQGSSATITTKKEVNGEIIEEVQKIEGPHDEVMAKIKELTPENEESATSLHKTVKELRFKLNPKSESTASGEVRFREEEGKVTLNASISGLTEGIHAIHIHEKADCSSEDGKSAGGHWNPTFQPHGAWGTSEGYHRGDIGNFQASKEGNGTVTFTTDLWCLGCDDETKNILGKAIIVHQGEDDLTSQPSGAAGARISCSGIIK